MEASAATRTVVEEYTGRSPFPPIADYAFLSDCETVALIAPSGNVEWMCLPRADSGSVFGALLDRDAGGFRLGPAEVEVPLDCEPNFDYGRRGADWEYTGDDYSEAVATADGVDLELKLTTDLRVGFEGRRARARHTLREGQTAYAALSWSKHAPPADFEEASQRMLRTEEFWRQWLNHGLFPDHPWRIYPQRSALTLKGLTYAPTGAMLAAATTSLPETPGGERNWDYRYSWIRDSTFMLWGLYTLGFDWEANDFFYFVADAAGQEEGEDLQIMYGIGGERTLDEQELGHLSGYEGAQPVRIRNG